MFISLCLQIVNRGPPLGNTLQDWVSRLPQYEVRLEARREPRQARLVSVSVEVRVANQAHLEQLGNTAGERHSVLLLLAERVSNTLLLRENSRESPYKGTSLS